MKPVVFICNAPPRTCRNVVARQKLPVVFYGSPGQASGLVPMERDCPTCGHPMRRAGQNVTARELKRLKER